jgi:hypothetical protein
MPPFDPDDPITQLALRFAADLRRLVESNLRPQLAAELQLLLARQVRARVSRAKPQTTPKSRPAASVKRSRTNELKRIAGTKPVACRVAGCPNPGVRAFGNLCHEHNAARYAAGKKKRRVAQPK